MIATPHPFYADPTRRDAFIWPAQMEPSKWVEQNRVLDSRQSAEPGPYRMGRTPYLRWILNTILHPNVREVWVMKAGQVGWSELIRSFLGYLVCEDPGPAIMALPDERMAREALGRYIIPMLDTTPILQRQIVSKETISRIEIILRSMEIDIGWAGSASTLASKAKRFGLADEVDKFPRFTGREADPISLLRVRLRTFGHRARLLVGSTPTTRHDGFIARGYYACDQQYTYRVPCPHCGKFQPLTFANLRWDKTTGGEFQPNLERAADVSSGKAPAWYECAECKGPIPEDRRLAMIAKGVWAHSGQTVADDGKPTPADFPSAVIGFHISGLCSPWLSFAAIAAEYLRAVGDFSEMMSFYNSTLGEPFEQQAMTVKTSTLRDKVVAAHVQRKVPNWATLIFATADTQKAHFFFTVRAWGQGFRSRLLYEGRCESFEDLRRICLDTPFFFYNEKWKPEFARALLIDSGGTATDDGGSRTDEVYRFALSNPSRIVPCKGFGGVKKPNDTIKSSRIEYLPPGRGRNSYRIDLRILDTGTLKDILADRMNAKVKYKEGEADLWELHGETSADYIRQMSSEHKIIERSKKGGSTMRWVPISSGAPNHFWDCEVLQTAAAMMFHIESSASEDVLRNQRDLIASGNAPGGYKYRDENDNAPRWQIGRDE